MMLALLRRFKKRLSHLFTLFLTINLIFAFVLFINIPLYGKHIWILPSFHFQAPIDPALAPQTGQSRAEPPFFHQFWSPNTFDKNIDEDDGPQELDSSFANVLYHHRWTIKETLVTLMISVPSIIFIVNIFVTLYRCMCSRRYDEWRSTWSWPFNTRSNGDKNNENDHDSELISEVMPIKLHGHEHEIEFLSSNISRESPFVVSCCIQGDIKVWDIMSGECHTSIKRSVILPTVTTFKPQHKPSGSFSSDSTYGSSPGTESNEFLYDYGSNRSNSEPNPLYYMQLPKSYSVKTNPNPSFNFEPYSRFQASKHILTDVIVNAAAADEDDEKHYGSTKMGKISVESNIGHQAIWSIHTNGKYIFVGCAKGRIEIWDILTGGLLFHTNEENSSVTIIKGNSERLVVGYLNGMLRIYQLKQSNGFICSNQESNPQMHCCLIKSFEAHSQPVTAIELESSHILSGSLDHLLKVFSIDNGTCSYTLHGHCGGITVIHADPTSVNTAITGCQAGQVYVWDLQTGTCVFRLEGAHAESPVSSILATQRHVISAGTDSRICVWDKYSGHLIHTIYHHHSFSNNMVLLTENILITAEEDRLGLWDLSGGSLLKFVALDKNQGNEQFYIKNLHLSSKTRALVCDYGQQICVIHFPDLTEKYD